VILCHGQQRGHGLRRGLGVERQCGADAGAPSRASCFQRREHRLNVMCVRVHAARGAGPPSVGQRQLIFSERQTFSGA
jgi:hypothetical protein